MAAPPGCSSCQTSPRASRGESNPVGFSVPMGLHAAARIVGTRAATTSPTHDSRAIAYLGIGRLECQMWAMVNQTSRPR
jgi:hypothetical protein